MSENNQDLKNDEYIKQESPEIEQTPNNKLKALLVLSLAAIVLVFSLISFLGNKRTKSQPEQTVKEIQTDTKVSNKNFGEASRDKPRQLQNEVDLTPQIPVEQKINEVPKKPIFKPKVYKSSGSLLVDSNGAKNNNVQKQDRAENRTPINQTKEDAEFDDGAFIAKAASKSKYNPSLLLPKGTYIGCSLNTRLVSMISGSVVCTISEDVYSSDGVTLLIEKGSKVYGSFKSGQMNDGMNRIFVAWHEIRTPNNINIPVSSGASDELGGSGMPGYVDHQWLTRFGSAILLSIVDDALNYVANGKRDNSYDYTENSREATQQMANTALEEFIKIKPVLYINQGDIVGILVNRDIDFSRVYKLKISEKE
ncbi:MAG: type IV secretion system protein VirB10 [Campylobacter sp.]|nr:type IV secretion system protein VirB10 [Campylobacter sp.]